MHFCHSPELQPTGHRRQRFVRASGGCTNPEACNFMRKRPTTTDLVNSNLVLAVFKPRRATTTRLRFTRTILVNSTFGYDCDGNCLMDEDGDEVCDPFEIVGCQDMLACNFGPATDVVISTYGCQFRLRRQLCEPIFVHPV